MKHERNLLKEPVRKLFFHYLLPSISATLVTSIYILADTIMIGNGVGADGIAALNIILPLFSLFFGTGVLFGVGGAVLFSMAAGEGDTEKGKKYFTVSVIGAAVMSIVYVLVFGLFFEPIVTFMGANATTIDYIKGYGYYLVFGAPVFLFSSLMQTFVRNDRNPRLAMIGVITGGVLNVILDYVFIFPLKMGMGGAALASVIGSAVTLCIVLSHLLRKKSNLKWKKGSFSGSSIIKIVKSGSASFLIEIASGIVIFMFNLQLLKYVGDIGVTVYGIISNSALVAMSLANGVAQASQPLAAVNYGAGFKERVKQLKHLGLAVTTGIGIMLAAVGLFCPDIIVRIFVEPTPEITELARPAVSIYFLSFLFLNANLFFTSYFQATMRSGLALVLSMLRGFLFTTICVYLLPTVFGVTGIWLVMPITEAVTLGICLLTEWRSTRHIMQQ